MFCLLLYIDILTKNLMMRNYRLQLRVRSSSQKDFSLVSRILCDFQQSLTCFCSKWQVDLRGPIPLPEQKKLVTLHRSVHGDNKSREQRAFRISGRLWVFDSSFFAESHKNLESSNSFFTTQLLKSIERVKKSQVSFDWSLSFNSLWSPLSLMVRTPPFRGGNTSSNLVEDR